MTEKSISMKVGMFIAVQFSCKFPYVWVKNKKEPTFECFL